MNLAEKIEQIARVIDPYAFDESGMTVDLAADAEWQTQGQRRDNARDTARAILSLLQQGEPEGALRKAYNKIEQHMFDYTHETHSYDASTNAWECSNGEVVAYVEGLDKALEIIKPLLPTSPLPPAPGAETGDPVQITFGAGLVTVDTGTWKGKPAVFIADAKQPGVPGESAKREGHDRYSLQPGERVWIASSHEHAKLIADALCNVSSSRQAVLEEAHPVWRGDVRCAPELGGCWIDDQGKCQHCGFQYERKK